MVDTTLELQVINLPARDKQVLVYGDSVTRSFIEEVDHMPGENYLDKLQRLPEREFVVVNVGTDHKSFAVSGLGLSMTGLLDDNLKSAYLVIADAAGSAQLESLLSANPLRYLLYRFSFEASPQTQRQLCFIHSEAICSKWRRWCKSGEYLKAFNALEARLLP